MGKELQAEGQCGQRCEAGASGSGERRGAEQELCAICLCTHDVVSRSYRWSESSEQVA